ncbi:BMC domain-containing protein [Moellerella wisconsensis]|uniref:Bacterial microcompartment protein homohexamer n=3 Tax=Moellerella wisconsensis TaxID=158849 RepID=A0A0N0IBS6_9GAMM|nr:BMC domain-containing protein [Moellerella wisconsensis]KLN96906.1 BMC domain-containing protein [Moellerella wisconsensis]KPD04153.1 EutM family ethanolamine utilization polyhedral-body-like protein [Moellerella wisconsensis ATCC 35017]UNH24505.1 BMC domain-containing protein [Moellerella wisconsensis]UNH27610.1 BMC domain-containing protein [Moellerella wisconsensis]UNH31083.1 BMC domain-containing protein [Moellerella wisconsensis]
MGDALGLIETQGLVACIEAADAMCKAANVELIGYENVGSGLVTAMVKGDVGAVKAAVDSGIESAQRVGTVVTSLVIPRPHNDIQKIIAQYKVID